MFIACNVSTVAVSCICVFANVHLCVHTPFLCRLKGSYAERRPALLCLSLSNYRTLRSMHHTSVVSLFKPDSDRDIQLLKIPQASRQ